ncbi:glycosyltransferase family 9 protein [Streptomyces sp. NPDC050703]|uniref:glycosyltransferase family 9 protein n=1 Tax=Streptomyces sp. NPDC050703 TaxID=3157218 RepID=UPI003418F867
MKALVVFPDSMSGVLLAGPAVRAVAASADHVTVLSGPRGAPAARLLPGVDDVLVDDADPDGPRGRLAEAAFDAALVLTPPEESPPPAALPPRTAHVPRAGGDGRGGYDAGAALATAAALGFHLRHGDDGGLRVHPAPDTTGLTGNGPYIVLHPGNGTPARAGRAAEAVALLADSGQRVVVTGGPEERGLTRRVSGDTAVDLGGRTDLRTLSGILRAADAVVTGSPGPAALAAAAGTPVALLGDEDGPGGTTPDVVRAVRELLTPQG